jgi:ABC-type transporter Mla subunit MlaD
MRGIKVGNVKSFKILPDLSQGVEVVVQIAERVPIRTTTAAVIDRNLLTGLASIDLRSESGTEGPMLEEVPAPVDSSGSQGFHVIKEGKVPFKEIADSAEGILKKMSETLGDISLVLNPENRAHLKKILENTERLTASLNRQTEQYGTIPNQVENVAGEISAMSKSLEESVSNITLQIHRFTESVRVAFNVTAGSLRSSSEKLGAAAEGFEQPGSLLLGPNKHQLGPGEAEKLQ